jgi:hypothetical protein
MGLETLKICILCLLVISQPTHAWGRSEIENQPQENTQGATQSTPCSGVIADDAELRKEIANAGKSPGWVQIMPARYTFLQQTLKGLRETGVPLIADYGGGFAPAEHGDDAGLFYFVPLLANSFGLNLGKATDLFLAGMLFVAFLVGTGGLFLFLTNWLSRIIGLAGMLLVSWVSLNAGDVYVFESAVVMLLVPWFLYFSRERKSSRAFMVFAFFAGFSVAFSNLIRNHSGTSVLIWAICVVAFYLNCSRAQKLLLVTCMIAGCLIPELYFHGLLARRNSLLLRDSSESMQLSGRHVFWHSVYIGFSFLSNDLVPAYRDEVGIEKVHSISPQAHYLSSEYEDVLRDEVINLVKHHKSFVVLSLAAKLGVITAVVLVSANLGLIAALKYPKPWPLELAFWAAIGFTALPGMLVVPHPSYMIGLIAFGFLYGIVSIQNAIDHGVLLRKTSALGFETGLLVRE